MSTLTTKERNEKVLAVLRAATAPLSPSQIACKINEPWCCWGPRAGMSAPISPICKRIGAVAVKRGQWVLPATPADSQKGEGDASD